ncbi:hypothetical protein C5167_030053 [Papaver somniferum]|nr:hypothetical protein C5167_030053 [Papaver somniferum]
MMLSLNGLQESLIGLEAEKMFLEKEKKCLEDMENLKAKYTVEIEILEAKLIAHGSKYRRLKKKIKVTVSNLTKDAIRIRDEAVKGEVREVCTDHSIPMPEYDLMNLMPMKKPLKSLIAKLNMKILMKRSVILKLAKMMQAISSR